MADADGLDKSVPTPQAAAQELHDILESLPAFEPCCGPVENWPPEMRQRRFPAWDIWPVAWRHNPPVKFKETWTAYGGGWLVMCDSECRATRCCRVSDEVHGQTRTEAVQRIVDAPARAIPDAVRQTLTNQWRLAAGVRNEDPAVPEVFVRNEWYERRLLVREEMPRILRVLDSAVRAVRQANGDENPIFALRKDDLLHDETRDRAIAQLREVPHLVTNPPPMPKPPQASQARDAVGRVLEQAQRHSLRFLMNACYSLSCYRTLAHSLAVDRTRTGKVGRHDVQVLQERMERCVDAAADLHAVFAQAWSLLVNAHRPKQGSTFAFQCVYDMSRAAVANWQRLQSTIPGAEALDLIITTGRYILCSEDQARTYWSDINNEFAVARHQHDLGPLLFRHPQADEMAALNAMVGDLLKPLPEANSPDRTPRAASDARPTPPERANTLKFSPASETAVTAIVRAVANLRMAAPDFVPTQERIKEKAGKSGGAGDRAVKRAIELGLITVDYLMTQTGRQFLADRS